VKIVGLQKVSLIDYPDRIACTVFLAGCNLDCGYCYNRWMIDAQTAPEALAVDDLLAWLGTRRGLLDAVCVSGGEPTLAADLAGLLGEVKGLGFLTKLDTNGTRPQVLRALLDAALLDYVAMDLKAPLDERYAQVAGRVVDLSTLRESMAALREWGGGYEYRTTVGPQMAPGWLEDIARELQDGEMWYLQVFRATDTVDPVVAAQAAPEEDELVALAERLRDLAPSVRVRGMPNP